MRSLGVGFGMRNCGKNVDFIYDIYKHLLSGNPYTNLKELRDHLTFICES